MLPPQNSKVGIDVIPLATPCASQGILDSLLSDFRNPPATYRLVPFWSWNEEMEPGEIRRQVGLIKKGGWGGAFVHSRIGLTTPYLGEDWFKAVDATLEACEKEELLVWLYDEDKWPSGYSGGTVPLADERFRAKALLARPVGEDAPVDSVPIGNPVDGLQLYLWTAPLGDPWFNGTCAVDRGSKAAMAQFIKDAYESYFRRYGSHYGKAIQAEFTDEPCMMFRVACPPGAVPHSETAFERFEKMHGYDPLPQLHQLFTDGPTAQRFRLHWHRTINDLFENNFSRQLGEWCNEHGINLTGHYMCEHGVFAQQNWGVKIMPNYRHQDIPGIDHLGRQIHERITAKQCQSVVSQFGKKRMLSELYGVAGGGLSFEDRKWIALQQIALGVNLLNPHLSLYTMAGCRKRDFPQNIFYQQPWWELNHLLDVGLARLCAAMSQGACRAGILLLHPQESAQALWQTRSSRFHEDLTAPYEGQDWNSLTPDGEKRIKKIEKQFLQCIDLLLGAQRSFNLGDEWILRDHGTVVGKDGQIQLQVEKMRYRLVVIPSMETMAPETFQLLRAFRDAGGAIIVNGEPPEKIDGEVSAELSAWIASLPRTTNGDFTQTIEALVPATVRVEKVHQGDPSLLWAHPRQLDDGSRLLLLVNLSRTETFSGDLRIQDSSEYAYQLNESSGTVTHLPVQIDDSGATGLSLEMAPCECRLLLFTETQKKEDPPRSAHMTGEETATPLSDWRCERLDDNALTLDYAAWKDADGSWSCGEVPVIELQNALNARKYDGALALRYQFRMEELASDCRLHIVVEHPERCRIFLNGELLHYAGLPHWRDIRWLPIDITGKAIPGCNQIVLEYDNFQHGDPAIVEPATARYGTEIESLYLVGDFSVAGKMTGTAPLQPKFQQWQVPDVEVDTLEREGISLTAPRQLQAGDITSQGLPFYAGRFKMECDLPPFAAGSGPVLLEIQKLNAPVAEVQIDGHAVGHFLAHPLRVELPESVCDGKPHRLGIVLYSTLRNLLGPHHHIDGELIEVGPDHFYSRLMMTHPDRAEALRLWAAGAGCPADWRDDYCLIRFGDVGATHLIQAKFAVSAMSSVTRHGG